MTIRRKRRPGGRLFRIEPSELIYGKTRGEQVKGASSIDLVIGVRSYRSHYRRMRKDGKLAVYAGSFDPLTLGHTWMIEQGVRLFDRLMVAIGTNPEKRYAFSLEDRLEMLRRSTRRYRTVKIGSFSNQFLITYARSIGASHILRGIRSESDYEFERVMRNINGDLSIEITTVFLMPPRGISDISSSMVKGLIGPAGWEGIVRDYVPAPVFEKLKQTYSSRPGPG